MNIEQLISEALSEDIIDSAGIIPEGDHSSLSVFGRQQNGTAKLLVKDHGVLAGVNIALQVFTQVDPSLRIEVMLNDGDRIAPGDIVLLAQGNICSLLRAERVVLNFMQRMSGIATTTATYVEAVKDTKCKILDTRKTTPALRGIEKLAVKIGGGYNHRFGLYDMIMLKDNHVDFAGGVTNAIHSAINYLKSNKLNLAIEIETRNVSEVKEVLEVGQIQRIMLDNFTPADVKIAVALIAGRYETEASGGITLATIHDYAAAGVDFISVGALTHSVKSLDLSFKATFDSSGVGT